ncbi:MAG: hypothetical protein PUE34_00945 [Clostridiaceae bacterium]|nr:hypothetical protein [Clostridiaceae bacterium]
MKKVITIILCIVMLVSVCPTAFAASDGTTYYVDSINGDDTNSGKSVSSAWKTLEKASSEVYSEGDKILLKAGSIFDGTFTAQGSGNAENPITFGAYGDTEALGKPVVRSNEDVRLVDIHNVSGWLVENIEFTAPNGKGNYITADGSGMTTEITVRDCVFHDIYYKRCETYSGGHCPIMLSSSGATARLRNITLKDCNIYDCAYGVNMGGLTREWTPDLFVSPEDSYNTGYTLDGLNLNNILYDGIIITSVYGMVIRNCALINTSLNDDYPTAPMWSHHASNYLVENCEIAGATNPKDGMAIDFDGWTTDSTYQYIYSHDNVRFITNCCYDSYTKNRNCTVRYCLSVNDNKKTNILAQLCTAGIEYEDGEKADYMDNFKFYNNTIINASSIRCCNVKNSYIANNIITGDSKTVIELLGRTIDENTGEKQIRKFEGVITNNCFWGMGAPATAKNSYFCNPGFVGTEETDKNSFMLSSKSRLIGKGIQVEEDMGEYDFYGNELTDVHNIGCYDGTGEGDKASIGFFNCIAKRFNTLIGFLNTLWVNINNIL